MQSRRVFLGSAAAAGIGSAVGGGAFLLDAGVMSAQQHGHDGKTLNPMFDLFIRESSAIRREIRRSGVRGEHARRHALAVRMLATHGRETRLDDLVRESVRQLIRDRGREAILQAPVDHEKAVDELRAHGAVNPEELPDANRLTREQRLAALTGLLRDGITPFLMREADLIERAATELDRYGRTNGSAVIRVALGQQQPTKEECLTAWRIQIMMKEAAAIYFCMSPLTWEICVMLQINILAMQSLAMYVCSDNP
jgi:hypothetical protein